MTEPRTKPTYPARRRLIIAAVIWVLLIRTAIAFAADALAISELWRGAISVLLFLAIFLPLSLAAMRELSDARRRGDEPPAPTPSRRSLVVSGIFTALFWALAIWSFTSTREFVFPLIPVICTVWLVAQIRRYRRASDSVGFARAE